jgi:hypothetical protein
MASEEKKQRRRVFPNDYESTRKEWLKRKKKKNLRCLECIHWYLLVKAGIVNCGVPFARFRHKMAKCDFALHKDLCCIKCLKTAISLYEDGKGQLQKPLNPLSHVVEDCDRDEDSSFSNEVDNKIEVCGVCGAIGHDYKTHVKT